MHVTGWARPEAASTAAASSSGPGAPRWMWGLGEPAEAAGAALAASAGAHLASVSALPGRELAVRVTGWAPPPTPLEQRRPPRRAPRVPTPSIGVRQGRSSGLRRWLGLAGTAVRCGTPTRRPLRSRPLLLAILAQVAPGVRKGHLDPLIRHQVRRLCCLKLTHPPCVRLGVAPR